MIIQPHPVVARTADGARWLVIGWTEDAEPRPLVVPYGFSAASVARSGRDRACPLADPALFGPADLSVDLTVADTVSVDLLS